MSLPPIDAPKVEHAIAYAALGWHVVPLHTPLFDSSGACVGCTCEDYKRSAKYRNWLAERGREGKYDPHFVCPDPGKHPRGTLYNATSDYAQIVALWKPCPDANIGLHVGASGLLAIDKDSYKEDFQDIPTALNTITSNTGGGGTHLLYLMPEGKHYGNDTGGLKASGIDVRGYGGIIVLSPSMHASGNRYQWVEECSPDEIEAAPLPTFLRDILDAAQSSQGVAGVGSLSELTPSDIAPELARWNLKAETTELIFNPVTISADDRSDADGDIMRDLILAGARDQDVLDIYSHYDCGQRVGTKFAERGLSYLEQHIVGARKWANKPNIEQPTPAKGDVGGANAMALEAQRMAAQSNVAVQVMPTEGVAIADAVDEEYKKSDAQKIEWTIRDILTAQLPDPVWIVDDLLPAGLATLGGRPKLGKSWLGLQIAVAVGTGGMVFDKPVKQRPVLYLALEDGVKRIQSRLRKQNAHIDGTVDFRFEWPSLAKTGTEQLRLAITARGYGLVVIDTTARILGREDQMDLGLMGERWAIIQRMAIDNELCILTIDHHNKSAGGDGGDVVDAIMGSTGKTAASDVVAGLFRQRGQRDATLKITGRDIEEQSLAVKFDATTGCWQSVGTTAGVRIESVQGEILAALDELGGKATAAKIAQYLGKKANNISYELQELVTKGAVERMAKEGVQTPYRLIREP